MLKRGPGGPGMEFKDAFVAQTRVLIIISSHPVKELREIELSLLRMMRSLSFMLILCQYQAIMQYLLIVVIPIAGSVTTKIT